jgi:hypothetical protein
LANCCGANKVEAVLAVVMLKALEPKQLHMTIEERTGLMYKLVNPPFEHGFKDASEAELQAYHEWFLSLIPERVRELEAEVRRTSGFESWKADFTLNSLDTLREWYAGQVEERPLTLDATTKSQSLGAEGMSFLLAQLSQAIPTYRTLSLAFDVGVYSSQVCLKNCEDLSWRQVRSGNGYDGCGHSVLAGLDPTRCSTALLATTLSYGITIGRKTMASSRALRDVWSNN